MKPIFTFFAASLLAVFSYAQGTFCNSSGGNIVLFTNYDGGILTINVNQNIPNLKIGVVSYESMSIVITGTYAGNVTEVRYAGYNNVSSGNCYTATTSISGAGSASTSITFAPTATLSNSYGYGSIICAYSCDVASYQGGCNTVDQIEDYFLSIFSNSSIFMHRVQYGCWSGTQNISAGGDCCALSVALTGSVSDTAESCFGECDGIAQVNATGGQSPYSYSWSTGSASTTLTGLCPGTYTVTITDNAGDMDTVEVEIDAATLIASSQFPALCNGGSITVGSNTYNTPGNYVDTLTGNNGCDSIVSTFLTIYPEYSSAQSFNPSDCDDFSVTVGPNTYTSSGSYSDTLVSSTGCDSMVYTSITIVPAALISAQPANEVVSAGNTATFTVSPVSTSSDIQWQENAGTGFVDLSNAGPYSGATSVTLSVAAVTQPMDNYLYRCIVSDPLCSDTSDIANLQVNTPAGIAAGETSLNWNVFPNPARDLLYVTSTNQSNALFQVIDLTGRVIRSGVLAATQNTLNLSGLNDGFYTLLIDGKEAHPVVITR